MKILLLGANGQLGWELQRALAPLGTLTALGHADGDLEKPLRPILEREAPDVIVNAAAYTAVDRAESEPERALRINGDAVGEIARAAAESGALFVHYSTDYVFDGRGSTPWRETDPTAPRNTYGRTKLAGETAIRACGCDHLIFRTSWVYAARGRNFARTILERAQTVDSLKAVADTWGVPTSAELLADVTALAIHRLDAARRNDHADLGSSPPRPAESRYGTYHLVPCGETTWHGYATELLRTAHDCGLPLRVAPEAIEAVPATAFPAPAARPLNSRLDNARIQDAFGLQLPDWRIHVRRLVEEIAGSFPQRTR